MNKPTYRPNCQYRRCWNHTTQTVSPATQYVVAPDRTYHVCAACAKKLADIHHLVGPDAPRTPDPPRPKLTEGRLEL